MIAIRMLASVSLDNQMRVPTSKIGKIWPDRELSNELEAIEPSIPEFAPEFFLGIIIRLPKFPRPRSCLFFRASHTDVSAATAAI